MPPLTMSLSWMTPSTRRVRRPPPAACRPARRCVSTARLHRGGERAAVRADAASRWRRPRPCGAGAPSRSTPLIRVWAVKGTKAAPRSLDVALAEAEAAPWRARRCCGPRASRRRARRAAPRRRARAPSTPGAGRKAGRLAVAERDGAGLVEQQHVDVAGRLDRAARGGDHVGLDHAVHAGDADGREQAADGGRDQADQQRDQHGER